MKRKSNQSKPARKSRSGSDFPLSRHPRGYWCKRYKRPDGKWAMAYFGKIEDDEDGQAALEEWLRVRADLQAGRTPRPKEDNRPTIKLVTNAFLNAKRMAQQAGEIGARTMAEYIATCERLARVFGSGRAVADLTAQDFEGLRADVAKTWGAIRLGNEVQRVRSVFGYAWEAGLLDRPVRFGPTFKKPSKRVLRVERAKRPARMFEADEIQAIMAEASVQVRAMILLGVSAGYGNHDVARLPLDVAQEAIRTGWLDWARPKSGIARRAYVWPEARQSLQDAIDARPTPKTPEAETLVFVTKYGKPWDTGKNVPVSAEFRKILDATGLHKPGKGFYCLRHVCETVGSGALDQAGLNLVMGHVDSTMAGTYRETIPDERLEAIAEKIRVWLFPPNQDTEADEPDTAPFVSTKTG